MQEPGNLQVVLMGMGTVFVCLIILIAVIMIMGKVMQAFSVKSNEEASIVQNNTNTESQEIAATIGVAVAEELGTEVSKIKIHSIIKLLNS